MTPQGFVYLNGQFVPALDAKISVFDRGFLFGDSLYDVFLKYQGKFLAPELHFRRLQLCAKIAKIPFDWSFQEFLGILEKLEAVNSFQQSTHQLVFYMQLTRGEQYPRRHIPVKNLAPNLLIFVTESPWLDDDKRLQGVKVALVKEQRRPLNFLKTTSLFENIRMLGEASGEVQEVIALRGDKLFEGMSSNYYAILHGKLFTPADDGQILSGITREIILDVARELGLEVVERPISVEELPRTEELWISSATRHLLPVQTVSYQNRDFAFSSRKCFCKVFEKYKQVMWDYPYRDYHLSYLKSL